MREYLGARGAKFAIFPGSGLARKQPQFLMAGELVETSRLWARQNAAIKPEWAEQLAGDLVKRTYSEPHWSKKRAAVMAHERVTLYGVPLVADRLDLLRQGRRRRSPASSSSGTRWSTASGTPGTASWRPTGGCSRRPRSSSTAPGAATSSSTSTPSSTSTTPGSGPRSSAARTSTSGGSRSAGSAPTCSTFDPSMLTHDTAEEVRAADYPEQWDGGEGLTFPISYHFEPGAADDGLTIDVPVATLNRVEADDFSWNVPGLREELVTSLIRSLPKNLRVTFVPAPNKAREFLAAVPPGEEPLLDALERWCRSTTGVVVPREAWDWAKVAEHLRPTYRVVDDGRPRAGPRQGPRGAQGAAAAAVRRGHRRGRDRQRAGAHRRDRPGSSARSRRPSTQVRAGHQVRVFPALVDEGATVGLQVFGSADEQEARHRLGVRRLLLLGRPVAGAGDPARPHQRREARPGRLAVPERRRAARGLPGRGRCRPSSTPARRCATGRRTTRCWPRRAREHEAHLRATMADVIRVLGALAAGREGAQRPRRDADAAGADRHAGAARRGWCTPGSSARRARPSCAATRRTSPRSSSAASGSTASVNRDRQLMDQVADLQDAYLHQVDALPAGRPPGAQLRQVRWMLEEYRVSLWAQQLGTPYPVSDQRIRRSLAGVS